MSTTPPSGLRIFTFGIRVHPSLIAYSTLAPGTSRTCPFVPRSRSASDTLHHSKIVTTIHLDISQRYTCELLAVAVELLQARPRRRRSRRAALVSPARARRSGARGARRRPRSGPRRGGEAPRRAWRRRPRRPEELLRVVLAVAA